MPDWYRNTDWNDEIEADFFRRLDPARSQRDQYLVLQALALADGRPDVALRLVDLYFETRTDPFDDTRARLAAARAHFARGGYLDAIAAYKAAKGSAEPGQGAVVPSPLEFAFLVARYRAREEYEAALGELLDLDPPGPDLPDPAFRFHAAQALIFAESGRPAAAARAQAEAALALPKGVLDAYADVVWRLRKIVGR